MRDAAASPPVVTPPVFRFSPSTVLCAVFPAATSRTNFSIVAGVTVSTGIDPMRGFTRWTQTGPAGLERVRLQASLSRLYVFVAECLPSLRCDQLFAQPRDRRQPQSHPSGSARA